MIPSSCLTTGLPLLLQLCITHTKHISLRASLLIVKSKMAHWGHLQSPLMDLLGPIKSIELLPDGWVKSEGPTRPASPVCHPQLTWEMWGTQIEWATFPSVVKFICTHPTQSARKSTDIFTVFAIGCRCEANWVTSTKRSTTPAFHFFFRLCGADKISAGILTGKEQVMTTNTVCGVDTIVTPCTDASTTPSAPLRVL